MAMWHPKCKHHPLKSQTRVLELVYSSPVQGCTLSSMYKQRPCCSEHKPSLYFLWMWCKIRQRFTRCFFLLCRKKLCFARSIRRKYEPGLNVQERNVSVLVDPQVWWFMRPILELRLGRERCQAMITSLMMYYLESRNKVCSIAFNV